MKGLLERRQKLFRHMQEVLSDEAFDNTAETIQEQVPKARVEKIMRDANELCRTILGYWEADLVAICTDTPATDLPDGLDFEHD